MASDAFQNTDMDLVAKADRIAREFTKRVKNSGIVIRLSKIDRLIFFGLAESGASEACQKVNAACDEICNVTMAKNATCIHETAPGITPDPATGLNTSDPILGAMGMPIRDKRGKAVGAICAVTAVPRRWSETDQLALDLARCQTEHLLARTALKTQINSLSKALGDYDNIATMIAAHADQTFSIHGPDSELLFATNALLQHVSPQELEAALRRKAASPGFDASGRGDGRDLAQQPDRPTAKTSQSVNLAALTDCLGSEDKAVETGSGQWRATLRNASAPVSFVQWDQPDG